jgi:hypothetical protein
MGRGWRVGSKTVRQKEKVIHVYPGFSDLRTACWPSSSFCSEVRKLEQADIVMVVVPEFVPRGWWVHLLHNQSAQFLKLALLFRSGFVVTSVPTHESSLTTLQPSCAAGCV